MEIKRVGDFSLLWGESLLWDDKIDRLYFVDCGAKKLHWLENGNTPIFSMTLPSVPTGIGLAEDERLLIALEDGLYIANPDNKLCELLTRYPQELGRRANDGTVDNEGNFITGSLKMPDAGSYWRYSSSSGWSILDRGISNANGPVVQAFPDKNALIFADTPAQKIYLYDYDGAKGLVTNRRVLADTTSLKGFPDGACGTSDGGILSCLYGAGVVAHYSRDGLEGLIEAGSEQPSDVAFGGPNLERLFVVSIKVDFGFGMPKSPLAGSLVEIVGSNLRGVREHRFKL